MYDADLSDLWPVTPASTASVDVMQQTSRGELKITKEPHTNSVDETTGVTVFYNAVGGERAGVGVSVQLNVRDSQAVKCLNAAELSVDLLYANHSEVADQTILVVRQTGLRRGQQLPDSPYNLVTDFSVRINSPSSAHQKKNFRLRVSLKEQALRRAGITVDPVLTKPIKVLTKVTKSRVTNKRKLLESRDALHTTNGNALTAAVKRHPRLVDLLGNDIFGRIQNCHEIGHFCIIGHICRTPIGDQAHFNRQTDLVFADPTGGGKVGDFNTMQNSTQIANRAGFKCCRLMQSINHVNGRAGHLRSLVCTTT